ncbi:MAG: class I SAM-dependent methyltransferase [Acidobacteriota bacterium]|nr:class I SAM-dependent methyltransferase [Acidobacteriota bacterium]
MRKQPSELEASYDRVAMRFAEEFYGELERKPFDRELLDRFADGLRDQGLVCEIGCGPGQVARYLKDRGVGIYGVDLSSGQIECARRLNPDITFERGDMLALDAAAASLVGVASFYTIIHLRREDVPRALQGIYRALRPGGKLLLSFHGGEGTLHKDDWYGEPVSIDITLFEPKEMASYLEAAGFEVERVVEREPYEFEYPTRRIYAFGRKPA